MRALLNTDALSHSLSMSERSPMTLPPTIAIAIPPALPLRQEGAKFGLPANKRLNRVIVAGPVSMLVSPSNQAPQPGHQM